MVEATDADKDGVPDNDPRVPLDEVRFGTNPTQQDTDGDGLNDLGELIAGHEGSANPLSRDTDGDGVEDGADPYPLYALQSWVQRYTPTIDGTIEPAWPHFFSDSVRTGMTTYLTWDPTALYLGVRFASSPRPFTVWIDANHDGFLRGPGNNEVADNYEIVVDPIAQRVITAHLRYPETWIWKHGVVWDETTVRPSDIGLAIKSDGMELELRIPANPSTRLQLTAADQLGITLYQVTEKVVFVGFQ